MNNNIIEYIVFGVTGILILNSFIKWFRTMMRIHAVSKFRMMVIKRYPPEVYLVLPSLKEMVKDGLELKIENYIENIHEFKEYQELNKKETL